MRRRFTVKASKRVGRSRITAASKKNFYGLPDVYLRYYNEWSDPEIEYKGKFFSYGAVEDYMLMDYDSYLESEGLTDDNYSGLDDYMRDQKDFIYEILDELYSNGDYKDYPYTNLSGDPFRGSRRNI